MATVHVLLDEDFNIIGTAQVDSQAPDGDEVTAGLSPRPDQQMVEIEVPDDVMTSVDAASLHATIRKLAQG